jgi:hypothetical protein
MIKWSIYAILIIGSLLSGYVWYNYYYVFGEGIKSGSLNFVVYKGNVFKTYEGKLIQDGFGKNKSGQMGSYEFEFSIEDKAIFEELEKNTGQTFDLHYQEYHNSLPWRGNSVYVVDRIQKK